MATETAAPTRTSTYRQFAVGATVYIVNEYGSIIPGKVTAVDIMYNGYPQHFVSFPTPLVWAGEHAWGIDHLRTLEEAKAQVAEATLLRSWFRR